jgi:hypothetical protein
MKKIVLIAIMFVALNVISGNARGVLAQEPPMAGAYGEVSTTDREVVQAARFAVSKARHKQGARVSLISIERAERQVVAGLNYRLCLKVKIKNKIQNMTAVVYKNLKQRYSLSSWEEGDCKSANGM